MFECPDECLELKLVCNGIPECSDYSDEGERKQLSWAGTRRTFYRFSLYSGCNELCPANNGCDRNCSSTPQGPACFCPAGQQLGPDSKTCILRPTETTNHWKTVMLIVATVVTLALVIVIVLVYLKYRQTRVCLQIKNVRTLQAPRLIAPLHFLAILDAIKKLDGRGSTRVFAG